jgi:alkylhydroperoxidase family enzyme
MRDYATAPVSEALRAALALINKLTLHPDDVNANDIAPLRALGVPDAAISEAIHICGIFNMIVRVADSLEFEVPALEDYGEGALKRGYK